MPPQRRWLGRSALALIALLIIVVFSAHELRRIDRPQRPVTIAKTPSTIAKTPATPQRLLPQQPADDNGENEASGAAGIVPSIAPARVPAHKYAFAAFLAKPSLDTKQDDDDVYFVGTRMLIYQLLHAPETQTNHSYPFIVLVTPDVAQSKIERLRQDGAEVLVVQKLALDWAKTRRAWQDVLTKLRLFELMQFDKVLFLDSDTLVTRRMDGIFDDPAAAEQKNLGSDDEKIRPADEGAQPATYLFAGNAGSGGYDHVYPPERQGNNLNAGCMVFRPSKELFDYYVRLAAIPDRYPGRTPEQSLWSYAHRRNGNMPWKQLHHAWNINWAVYKDKERGVASLHSKFWELDRDLPLRDFAMSIRWQMEGYWSGVKYAQRRKGDGISRR